MAMSFVNALMIQRPTLSNVPEAENKKPLCTYKSGHTCRIKRSHTCLQRIPRQMLVCCVVSVPAPMYVASDGVATGISTRILVLVIHFGQDILNFDWCSAAAHVSINPNL